MSVKEPPIAKVKRLHGSKAKLVDSLIPELVKDSDEDKGALKERLMGVANSKLLRLADVIQTVKDKYGSKEKLVETVSRNQNKAKDKDYVAKLNTLSLTRLLDMTRMSS